MFKYSHYIKYCYPKHVNCWTHQLHNWARNQSCLIFSIHFLCLSFIRPHQASDRAVGENITYDTNTNTYTNRNKYTKYNWRYDHKYNLKTAVQCSWLDLHTPRQRELVYRQNLSNSITSTCSPRNQCQRSQRRCLNEGFVFSSSQCTMARTTS